MTTTVLGLSLLHKAVVAMKNTTKTIVHDWNAVKSLRSEFITMPSGGLIINPDSIMPSTNIRFLQKTKWLWQKL